MGHGLRPTPLRRRARRPQLKRDPLGGEHLLSILDQIDRSLDSRLYYLALFSALTIPDIAGALEAPDGQATGERYKVWYEKWIRPRFKEEVQRLLAARAISQTPGVENPLTGDACYRFRCSLLHQGSTQHPKSPYSRIIFIEPGATTNVVHYGVLNGALCIDVPRFCREVLAGSRLWLRSVEGTEPYATNNDRFVRRYDNGLPPYIVGVPVIG